MLHVATHGLKYLKISVTDSVCLHLFVGREGNEQRGGQADVRPDRRKEKGHDEERWRSGTGNSPGDWNLHCWRLAFLHVVTGTLAIVAYVVGAVAIVTGLVRYCPAWSIFGINTCQAAHK